MAVSVLVLLVFSAGCAKYFTGTGALDESAGQQTMSMPAGGEQVPSEPLQHFSTARKIYFEFDKHDLNPEARHCSPKSPPI